MSETTSSSVDVKARAPKISVLVPTYNYSRYLPEVIESVLAQNCDDYEILISDDASTDNSAWIIQHYAASDHRIRFALHQTNLGMVANWNWCLQQARGDYVKFIFGDDALASPDALIHLAAMLDTHPTAVLATSSRLLFDENSKVTGRWNDLSPGLHDGSRMIARCLRTRRNLVGEPSAVMFRRSAAERGFDLAYRQLVDLEMWFHLLMQGALVYTSEPLCLFRRHSTQQTAINGQSRVSDLELIELLNRYLPSPAVRQHLRPGSLAHHQILFRQMHYARKVAANHATAALTVKRLRAELPPYQIVIFWIWHRLTRPFENLHRKILTWSRKVAVIASMKRTGSLTKWEGFLPALSKARVNRFGISKMIRD